MAGRDSGRPDRTDTGKLCGVFVVQGHEEDLNWTDSIRSYTIRDWTIFFDEFTLVLTRMGI